MPFAPHILFTQFLDDGIQEERGLGLKLGLDMLKHCQELWVFGERISEGMAAEIKLAKRLGVPIQYYSAKCERRELSYEQT